MARYRRNKSSRGIVEGLVGLIIMVSVIASINPSFKAELFLNVQFLFLVLVILAILGVLWYLLRQFKEEKAETAMPVSSRRPSPVHLNTKSRTSSALPAAPKPKPSLTPTSAPLPAIPTPQNFHPETPEYLAIQSLQPKPPVVAKQIWNESILPSIEWKRFEVVTKKYLLMTGYEARETKIGADGGVDIRVTKTGNEGFEGIIQCKAWNTYKVGVKPVRELFGVMAAEKVTRGMLITSGSFSFKAEEFAKGKIMLISGAKFLELIRKLPEEKQQKLLEIALEGDYRTPTCPQCDLKMILRKGKKGKNPGSQFWGCVRYPRCRQRLVYKDQV